jgi:hypothetical protein
LSQALAVLADDDRANYAGVAIAQVAIERVSDQGRSKFEGKTKAAALLKSFAKWLPGARQ